MKKLFSIIYILLFVTISQLMAQDMEPQEPTINPWAKIITETGEETENTNYSGSAPLVVHFDPGIDNPENYSSYFEWRFYENEIVEGQHVLVRHESETDFTFTKAGTHLICLIGYFLNGNDTIMTVTEEDYITKTREPISITISTSKLDFPNAFSPNGDGANDIYKAKTGYQSIVGFKATIYNRWGQKLYEWTDPAGGWDGTYKGSNVKEGVYYVHVQAKGADGRKYNIKQDITLLRGYTETASGDN